MVKLYTEAPAPLRRVVQEMLDAGDPINALLTAGSAGYTIPRPSTVCVDRVAQLRAAGDQVEAANFQANHAETIDIEKRVIVMWTARQPKAKDDSAIPTPNTRSAKRR